MRQHPARIVVVLAALAAACHTPPPARSDGSGAIPRDEVEAVLAAQTACWNRGDLPGFVATYWNGPELTFLGGSGVTRGAADLLANYQRGYPTAEARGVLSFEVLDFRALGTDHALLLGRYHLQRAQPADGVFTLVLARRDGRICIVHDHSSESPKRGGS